MSDRHMVSLAFAISVLLTFIASAINLRRIAEAIEGGKVSCQVRVDGALDVGGSVGIGSGGTLVVSGDAPQIGDAP